MPVPQNGAAMSINSRIGNFNIIMPYTATRRFFLLCSAMGTRLSAQKGYRTILPARIIASFVANQGAAETTFHVALAKFELAGLEERAFYSTKQGHRHFSGNPSDTASTAFLLIKSPSASLTPRGRVMSVVQVTENFQ
jgi:hypothetical protein